MRLLHCHLCEIGNGESEFGEASNIGSIRAYAEFTSQPISFCVAVCGYTVELTYAYILHAV